MYPSGKMHFLSLITHHEAILCLIILYSISDKVVLSLYHFTLSFSWM